MKRGIAALASLSAIVLALAAGATGASSQQSASGNGNTGTQLFSFSARGVGFGADGHITSTNPNTDPNTVIKGRINCLAVLNNQAYMTGNIVSISPPPNPAFAPTDFIAYAEDNGEPGDFRDRFQFFTFTPTPTFNPTCLNPTFTIFGQLITSGNIEVNPVP
jgi:hypothetical protein